MRLILCLLLGAAPALAQNPFGILAVDAYDYEQVFVRDGSVILPGWLPSSARANYVSGKTLVADSYNYIRLDTNRHTVTRRIFHRREDFVSSAFRPLRGEQIEWVGGVYLTNDIPIAPEYYVWSGPAVLGVKVEKPNPNNEKVVMSGRMIMVLTNDNYATRIWTFTCVDDKSRAWNWHARLAPKQSKEMRFDAAAATQERGRPVKWFRITSMGISNE